MLPWRRRKPPLTAPAKKKTQRTRSFTQSTPRNRLCCLHFLNTRPRALLSAHRATCFLSTRFRIQHWVSRALLSARLAAIRSTHALTSVSLRAGRLMVSTERGKVQSIPPRHLLSFNTRPYDFLLRTVTISWAPTAPPAFFQHAFACHIGCACYFGCA
jgi:ABC-type phosphonate transport system ATPase subunit